MLRHDYAAHSAPGERLLWRSGDRKCQRKRGSLPERALHSQLAIQSARKIATDRQAQANTFGRLIESSTHLNKRLPDGIDSVGWYPATAIRDTDARNGVSVRIPAR